MKKIIITIICLFGTLTFLTQAIFAETNGQCGNRIISLGDRYEDVLSKCGDPDGYSTFVNGFGVQVGIELRYDRDKGQYPVYFFFNARGSCSRIRLGSERK